MCTRCVQHLWSDAFGCPAQQSLRRTARSRRSWWMTWITRLCRICRPIQQQRPVMKGTYNMSNTYSPHGSVCEYNIANALALLLFSVQTICSWTLLFLNPAFICLIIQLVSGYKHQQWKHDSRHWRKTIQSRRLHMPTDRNELISIQYDNVTHVEHFYDKYLLGGMKRKWIRIRKYAQTLKKRCQEVVHIMHRFFN